ncbi:MAG TPA: hypothetical protein VF815_44855 [Myxococcaceae bacterium]|jgi:hypothetical protein
MWEHVRQGALHFPQGDVTPPKHPIRQFIHGLSLPFHLARALRTDEAAWRRYLKVAAVQCLVIVSLGVMLKRSATDAVDSAREQARHPAQRSTSHAEAVEAAREALKNVQLEVGHAQAELSPEARELIANLNSSPVSLEPPPAPAKGDSGETPRKGPRVITKLQVSKLEFWAAIFATLQIIQWVVIALSRDYHDAISRDASLLTKIEPEDGPITPSIRLDVPWMAKKISRRVRAFMVFLAGLPVLFLFAAPWRYTDEMMAVLVPLWSAYWLVVFTASKTAHSWEDTSGRAPWFLRGWTWLTTKVPGFRWGFLQKYGQFWENRTRGVFSPAVELEKQPWAFAGLGVIRALAILPLFKCFLRPLIPVAAAHLVLAHRASTPAAPTELAAPSAPPATPSSHAA